MASTAPTVAPAAAQPPKPPSSAAPAPAPAPPLNRGQQALAQLQAQFAEAIARTRSSGAFGGRDVEVAGSCEVAYASLIGAKAQQGLPPRLLVTLSSMVHTKDPSSIRPPTMVKLTVEVPTTTTTTTSTTTTATTTTTAATASARISVDGTTATTTAVAAATATAPDGGDSSSWRIAGQFNLPFYTTTQQLTGVVLGIVKSADPHVSELVTDTTTHADSLRPEPRFLVHDLLKLKDCTAEVLDRDESRRIVQLKVMLQFHPDNCGFHTSHNAIMVLRACMSGSAEDALACINSLDDASTFWCTFNRLQKRLKDSKSFNVSDIEKGLMNDFFMDFLVHATDGEFGALGGGDAFSAVPSFGLMQVPEMRALQRDVFAKVVKHKSRGHAFLLGSRSHWVACVVNKVDGQLEMIFLDSANKPILSKTKEELTQVASDRWAARKATVIRDLRTKDRFAHKTEQELEEIFVNGIPTPYPNYFIVPPLARRIHDSLLEIEASHLFLKVIHNACSGKAPLQTSFLAYTVQQVLSTARRVTTRKPADGSKEPTLVVPKLKREDSHVGLEYWVSTYTRPSMVHKSLVNKIKAVGVRYLDADTRKELLQWARSIIDAVARTPRTHLGRSKSVLTEGGTPMVSRLVDVLRQLVDLLDPPPTSPLRRAAAGAGGGAGAGAAAARGGEKGREGCCVQ